VMMPSWSTAWPSQSTGIPESWDEQTRACGELSTCAAQWRTLD
jgi:hypothetical protein